MKIRLLEIEKDFSGNIIYVNKEENVSVGMTGTFKPRIFDRVEFIEQKVLPSLNEWLSIMSEDNLTKDRQRFNVLERKIKITYHEAQACYLEKKVMHEI